MEIGGGYLSERCASPNHGRTNIQGGTTADAEPSLVKGVPSAKRAGSALNTALIFFSSLSFIAYGVGAIFTTAMRHEFERYQLGGQRILVGLLQWAAGVGLLIGLYHPWLGQAAAGGLALMMVVALMVRLRIKDTPLQMLPAVGYLLLNAYLCLYGF
jgi:hypothetical protein